jgi:hypothetical protein
MRKKEVREIMGSGLYSRLSRTTPKDPRWKTLFPVGHLGLSRNEFSMRMDNTFGIGRWRLVHFFQGFFIGFSEVCNLYQRSYREYFKKKMDLLHKLTFTANQICAEDASDLCAGCNYFMQEGERTQILAIAIRNVLVDLNFELRGRELVYLRGPKAIYPFCSELQPEIVPFCYPAEIIVPWYDDNQKPFSVEDFYINNRYLQVWREWKQED